MAAAYSSGRKDVSESRLALDQNDLRRHLNPSQRALVAARAAVFEHGGDRTSAESTAPRGAVLRQRDGRPEGSAPTAPQRGFGRDLIGTRMLFARHRRPPERREPMTTTRLVAPRPPALPTTSRPPRADRHPAAVLAC